MRQGGLAGTCRLLAVDAAAARAGYVAAGNPEWIGKAGMLNHDIETVEEFWSFAKKFSAHPQ